MVMPPPNVTGSLHMGHALNNTLPDILARYKRMDGFNVAWIPGADHASIAVHWVIERQLRAEKTDRHALGREAFLARAWQFKEETQRTITNQQRRLGVSCDWSRWRFTMDEGLSEAVRDVFVRLLEDGLIYRAERLVNWDPVSHTSVSDLEVVYEENVARELYSFAYPLSDGQGELVAATTRPETMLGDTAVAVHPEDARYKHLIGKTLRHPLLDRQIPVVADAILVDPAFGTGVVKITPAHDFNDFEVGKRHNLPMINILNKDGTLNAACGEFAGMSTDAARTAVQERLAELGLDRGSAAAQDEYRSLGALGRHLGAHALHPVVRAHQAFGGAFGGRGGKWGCEVCAHAVGKHLLQLAAQRARLVHIPTAMVGAPHPCVALPKLRAHHGEPRDARGLRRVRQRYHQARRRHPRHLVQLCAMAVFDAGLAQQNRGPAALLPHGHAHHQLRHHLLLGGSHDDVRAVLHGRGAVQRYLSARLDPRRQRPKDVQNQRQRGRPPEDGRPIRLRCLSFHLGGDGRPRARLALG